MRNEDYGRIWRLLADGRGVELEFDIVNRTHPEGRTSYNVVADIPASTAREGETPAQRRTRRSGHYEALTAAVLRDARAVDPNVDPAVVKRELAERLSIAEEQRALEAESGEGHDLLKAIAGYGGMWWEKNTGGFKGEVEFHAKEGRDARAVTRSGKVKYGGGFTTAQRSYEYRLMKPLPLDWPTAPRLF